MDDLVTKVWGNKSLMKENRSDMSFRYIHIRTSMYIFITICNLKQLFWPWEVKHFTVIPSCMHILAKDRAAFCSTTKQLIMRKTIT